MVLFIIPLYMTIISTTLKSLGNKCALIPFITAGNPNLQITAQAITILDQEGADIIEIGIPYSDPLADGPIIQEASRKALLSGTTLDNILELVSSITFTIKAPLILFTYYNPVLSRGMEIFVKDISKAGIKGLIIPDLPFEESDYMIELCNRFNIELVLLITPTSSRDRIQHIIEKSLGAIYVVSTTGVTGVRQEVHADMQKFIQEIKKKTNKSLILGFGISTIDHVEQVSQWDIDAIVIGSAFVQKFIDASPQETLESIKTLCSSVHKVLSNN
jgi:tryptophan synthase alpha chain